MAKLLVVGASRGIGLETVKAALLAGHSVRALARSAARIPIKNACDDKAAKAIVLELVDELGFDGVDAGGLDQSWRQQPGTPAYGTDLDSESVRRALSEANNQRTLEWRGTANSPGSFTAPA